MQYNFLSATVLLILITDPLGNIPIFINALRGVAKERRRVVILREVAIAFGILLVARVGAGWRGRRAAWLTLGGFGGAMLVLATYFLRHAA